MYICLLKFILNANDKIDNHKDRLKASKYPSLFQIEKDAFKKLRKLFRQHFKV